MSSHTTPIRDALASRQRHIKGHHDLLEGNYNTDDARAVLQELGRDYGLDMGELFDDEVNDSLNNYALSVEPKLHVTVFLALGGPTEWVDVECSVSASPSEGGAGGGVVYPDPEHMTYHYSWASEDGPSSVELHEDDPLWRFCAEQIESGVTL